jgi:hypothetical protein
MEESLIQHRLQRARETLEEARLLAEIKHWNAAVNRLLRLLLRGISTAGEQDDFSLKTLSGPVAIQSAFCQDWIDVKGSGATLQYSL